MVHIIVAVIVGIAVIFGGLCADVLVVEAFVSELPHVDPGGGLFAAIFLTHNMLGILLVALLIVPIAGFLQANSRVSLPWWIALGLLPGAILAPMLVFRHDAPAIINLYRTAIGFLASETAVLWYWIWRVRRRADPVVPSGSL